MANIAAITGVREVLANLARRNKQLAAGCERGVTKAGLRLQRASQLLVPVNFGVLKASAYTRVTGKGLKANAHVGYTASYALFVHENVEMKLKGQPRTPPNKGKYWDPQGRGQSKFLEEPARRMGPELLRVIKDEMRIK